ncbi:Lin0512 family protein [Leucothrix mucor]|uniref:Lin0512 family protein n=1 Tax=Leucothrix mucor TaxID=45248 RepID=UPI0003B48958|nr:Lin0512 family protein [Leucothrix mucor]
MAKRRMVVEMGMGTDLQGQDYTKAAVRAVKDALWHNSLTIAPAFGFDKEKMLIEVSIGVAKPELVDKDVVKAVFPYGQASVEVVQGGLDILSDCGTKTTVMANAAAVVYLDFAEESLA